MDVGSIIRRGADMRRVTRVPTAQQAKIMVGRRQIEAAVDDISSLGAKLLAASPPEPGTEIALLLDKESIVATVAWREANACGVTFHCPWRHARLARKLTARTRRNAPAAPGPVAI